MVRNHIVGALIHVLTAVQVSERLEERVQLLWRLGNGESQELVDVDLWRFALVSSYRGRHDDTLEDVVVRGR